MLFLHLGVWPISVGDLQIIQSSVLVVIMLTHAELKAKALQKQEVLEVYDALFESNALVLETVMQSG